MARKPIYAGGRFDLLQIFSVRLERRKTVQPVARYSGGASDGPAGKAACAAGVSPSAA